MATRMVERFGRGRWGAGAALIVALTVVTTSVEARGRYRFLHRPPARHHVAHAARAAFGAVGPKFAAMVVDANSGDTLYAVNEDEPRHPASITKVMTLYLLFEALEQGRLRLDSSLTVSAHAAAQAPTKLGLPPGSTITVDSAIKAIVTKSANDMAVAVAENIAGDEESFAGVMTRKAHALGMSHTFYHNASGLPDMRQITTARDLTILGRAIREHFPRYYRFFSTPSFTFRGSVMPNHNHLLGQVDGMDGIKTGYTVASGFNLLSSVNRDGRHVVSVVLGGRTAASRDRIMQALIETHIEEASVSPRTRVADAGPIEVAAPTPDVAVLPEPVERDLPPSRVADGGDTAAEAPTDRQPTRGRADLQTRDDGSAGPTERRLPRGPSLIAPDLAVPTPPTIRPLERARTEPPRPVPVSRPTDDRPRPAFIAGTARAAEPASPASPLAFPDRRRVAVDGSTNRRVLASGETTSAIATATPSSLRWVTGAQPARLGPSAAEVKSLPPPRGAAGETRVANAEPRTPDAPRGAHIREGAPVSAKGGWIIQIGATDDAEKARNLLSRAKSEGRSALASALPFTEKVQKGDSTLYRARFAGLDPNEAEAACRALKQSGFACFAKHN